MNVFGFVFALVMSLLLLTLPRNWAPLPLLVGMAYIVREQQLEIGPLHFPVVRILIAVGLLRVIAKGEQVVGGMNSLDRAFRLWTIWNICSIAFHSTNVWVFRLGILYDTVGTYYLFRVFVRGLDDVRTVFKMLCLILLPLAATMLVEKLKGINPLSFIGFGPPDVTVTNGHFRATGAFGHPILAGTAGAVCVPMAIYYWRENRQLALAGIVAFFGIVFASGSSGPIMATLASLGAVALWKIRDRLSAIRWLVILLLIVLSFIMSDPVYFLMARIDITGGSTGYFRAQLIRSTIDHFSEWWLAGTDYTRHWMASGIAADENHTDMTNYFVQMGVWGGLPLVLLFVGVLYSAFTRVGKALKAAADKPVRDRFLIWVLGSILFSHTTTFMSISYFDQTVVLLSLALALISALQVRPTVSVRTKVRDGIASRPERTPVGYQVSFS